jgi:hypothetical protein
MPIITFRNFDSNLLELLVAKFALEFNILDNDEIADLVISLDPITRSINDVKTIAIYSEPKVVRPDLYTSKRIKSYLDVVCTSSQRAESIGKMNWLRLPINLERETIWPKERISKTCMVIGNKFSANRHSNYGLRRKVIQLDERGDNRINVYGVDWLDPLSLQMRRRFHAARIQMRDLSEFSISEVSSDIFFVPKNYKGVMGSDLAGLSKYETSIVIENQSDYVSEKLWNTMEAGAVPVYIGPDLTEQPELEQCVFQVERSAKEIVRRISKMKRREVQAKRKKIREFLNEFNGIRQHEEFAKNLIKIVESHLQK